MLNGWGARSIFKFSWFSRLLFRIDGWNFQGYILHISTKFNKSCSLVGMLDRFLDFHIVNLKGFMVYFSKVLCLFLLHCSIREEGRGQFILSVYAERPWNPDLSGKFVHGYLNYLENSKWERVLRKQMMTFFSSRTLTYSAALCALVLKVFKISQNKKGRISFNTHSLRQLRKWILSLCPIPIFLFFFFFATIMMSSFFFH